MTRKSTPRRGPHAEPDARPPAAPPAEDVVEATPVDGAPAPPADAIPVPLPAKVHPANTLNDLTGAEWLYFTRSALTTAYPHRHGHARRKAHGANKPPALMADLVRFFTKPGGTVLDPFAGVGGTLLGAALTGRRACGIELNPAWAEVYRDVCRSESLPEQPLLLGDCRKLLADWPTVAPEGFARPDLICTDPPYNRNFPRTMAGKGPHQYRRTDYVSFSESDADLSNAPDYKAFLAGIGGVFAQLRTVVRDGGHMVVLVRNAYEEGRYRLVHAEMAAAAEAGGWVLKGEKVWYQAGTRLRPYGYPRSYIPNIAHQHILIFRAG